VSIATPFEERLVDAVGPIVVKEVRQGLRARIFGIAFALLLVGCLVAAIAAMAEARYGFDDDLGRRYFAIFLSALGVLEFFVIPFTAFRSTIREREDETWVLLALTGLGGARIVRGKVISALSQGMLYASACAPFVLFSYYLNGVALPTLVVALGLAAAWTVFLVALAVALGTQAATRKGRAGSHLVAIGLLLALSFMGIVFAAVLADEGERLMRENGFLAFLGGLGAFSVSTSWLLVEGAAASLALPTEAASRRPRVALTVQIVAACVVGAAGLVLGHAPKEGAAILSAVVSFMLVLTGTFAISEHDGAPRAHQAPGWLKPGALRSYGLVAVLLLVSTAVWASVFPSLRGSDYGEHRMHVLLAGPGYVLFYLSLAAILGRSTPLARLGEPVATRVAMLGLVIVSTVFSPIAGLILGGSATSRTWTVLNPLFGMFNFADRIDEDLGREMLLVLWCSAAMACIAATVVLKARDGVRHT
jgi:hypothetical protein